MAALGLLGDLVTHHRRPNREVVAQLGGLRRPHLREAVTRVGGKNLRVFGSVATGTDGAGSDIDLLVDLPETTSILGLLGLRRELSAMLGEPVDIVPARSLRPEVAAEAHRHAIPL